MNIIAKQPIIFAIFVLSFYLSPSAVRALSSPASTQLFMLPSNNQLMDKKTIKFSPDGKRFWYIAKQDAISTLVVDGKEIQAGKQAIQSFAFSPDSKHYAYVTSDEQGKFFVVYDGTPNPMKYAAIPSAAELDGSFGRDPWLQFSDVGGHYAYVGLNGENEKDTTRHVVIDGIEQTIEKRLPMVGRPVFNRDGKHHGYITYEPLGLQPNAYEGEDLEDVKVGNLIIDTESQRMILGELSAVGAQVIYDGKVIAAHTSDKGNINLPLLLLSGITLSPDGGQYAHIAFKPNNKVAVSRNGRTGPLYDGAHDFTFSNNGASFAYTAKKDKKQFVVFNDKVIGTYSNEDPISNLMLSTDGKHIGYVVRGYEKGTEIKKIYIDGKKKIDSWDNPADLFAGRNGIFYTGPVTSVRDQNTFDRNASLVYNGRVDNANVAMNYGLTLSPASDAYRVYIGYDISKRKKECYQKTPCTYSIDNPRKVVVLNGKIKEQIPDGFYVNEIQISPRGKHYAYILHRGAYSEGEQEQWMLIVDGKKVNQYPYLSNLHFIDENTVRFNDINGSAVWNGIHHIVK